jgi:hypothetical protein
VHDRSVHPGKPCQRKKMIGSCLVNNNEGIYEARYYEMATLDGFRTGLTVDFPRIAYYSGTETR